MPNVIACYEVDGASLKFKKSCCTPNNHNFEPNSMTEEEFMNNYYKPANEDAIEFIITYIKNDNTGKFVYLVETTTIKYFLLF